MNHPKLVLCALAVLAVAGPLAAQTEVRWSGLFYMDYEYILSASDEEAEGENGFDYRRLYLTADYTLSDEFSGRARLEAASQPTSSAPLVKDMYLKWKGVIGAGHDLVFGVQSPPVFTLSEKMWGYRSLEKTIMDRQKVVSSRDMGIKAAGKLTEDGNLTYGLMLGNNNSIRGEDDKYKRVYGQLAWQSENVAASVGGDFASGVDRNAINTNAFAGYRADRFRVGAEGFIQQVDFDDTDATLDRSGISVWLVAQVNENVEAIGRVDYSEVDAGSASVNQVFLIGGVAFRPASKVRLIPNIYVVDVEGADDPEIAGRVTLHADF
jgi:hypothetical protein